MDDSSRQQQELSEQGFTIIESVFSGTEVEGIARAVEQGARDRPTFRRSADLFAIRQFLKEVPEAVPLVLNQRLSAVIEGLFGKNYAVVKSIYFDKPAGSNWFVAYHQDLTISVDRKVEQEGFGPWTVKQDQYAVQPPLDILENNFTVRIHLDDTDEANGALRVVPGSHRKGIYRPETIDWSREKEVVCPVPRGGVMIMRPLLLHASGRTTNHQKRRVVHIEFSNQKLPAPLQWSELLAV